MDRTLILGEPAARLRINLLEQLVDLSIRVNIHSVSDLTNSQELLSTQGGSMRGLLLARSQWIHSLDEKQARLRNRFVLPLVIYDPEFTARLESRGALYLNLPASVSRWEKKLFEAMSRRDCDACWRNQLNLFEQQDSGHNKKQPAANQTALLPP